jgi:tRNA-dihydrouridine synthase A
MASTSTPTDRQLARRIAVAPMIDVTDRHFRMMIRAISPLPMLWTEMTWDRAILYNTDGEKEAAYHAHQSGPRTAEGIIGFSPEEHPIVLQFVRSPPPSIFEHRAGARILLKIC